jgi:Sec-independent protein translocase protein TatA
MNIIGIGPFELLIIFLVAFLFLGPDKLSKFSKDFANYVRGFNKQKKELNDLIDLELDSNDNDLDDKDEHKR